MPHDPRSRDLPSPTSPGEDVRREPTQSLNIAPDDAGSPAELALGTHNRPVTRPVTRIESPAARSKTPGPAGARATTAGIRPEEPADYVDAVLGSYRVSELLGKGGMGYVFRAEHVKLGREVALKLLRSDYASRRDAVARFFQEARTVNRVRHRNIVDVTDFVELDDGTTYIVMELLTGQSLGAWAQTGVDLPRALAVLVQICDGLGAAHQVGVVHRDLKPDNVIVVPTSDGAELVKLLDFGVAKLLNRDDEDVGFQTAAGSVIGTPAYMSPEQAGGMEIDARSDIYSLGAIMYELFSGQPLFRGRTFGEYVRKHLTEMPVPPSQTPGGAGIDPRLEAVVLRCLDKDPEQRFAQIAELRETLLHMLGGMELRPELGQHRPGPQPLASSAPRSLISQLPLAPPQPTQVSHVSGISGAPPVPGTSPSSGASQISSPTPASGRAARAATAGTLPTRGAPAPAAGGTHPSGNYLAPLTLSGEYSLPAPPRPPRALWWAWAAGASVAVAVGTAAAIWYAGRGGPGLVPAPHPGVATAAVPAATAAPAAQPPPTPAEPVEPSPPRAHLVEVRFDSRPSGRVFADGSTAELCQTPCAFDIDLSDGGPSDRRGFVVRRAGYADGPITVDLTGGQREFQVTLVRAAGEPRDGRSDAKVAKPDGDRRTTRRPPRARKDRDRDIASRPTTGRPEPRDADPARAEPAQAAAPRPDPPRPAATAPAPAPVPAIDPADTLDPFQRKK